MGMGNFCPSAGGTNMSMSALRPRRKCASLSLSYQEPSLKCKLRRGDPFTDQAAADWNLPDHKDRKKKTSGKSNILTQRKVLREVQNQL
ncbi:hypothetical protein GBAR_LOCUS4545 [Geodia barretti]|uniref:Uncharacterized protein n=1 Tax=Geodia barretti TaxID=519541 RepID=A0AA35R741_GEOBA|nr:hypothetical protein GBAR_LOCUS4545 [Geodia barretti]